MKRLLLASMMVSCAPELEGAPTTITAPRLIAVRATPAEVKPGESVTLEAIVVGGDAKVSWDLCLARTPLGESGPIDPACAIGTSPELVPLGGGAKVEATIPRDACRLFGPERPDPKPGEPSGRPVDPDSTGGFQQPIRVAVGGASSVFGVRIHCGIPSATPAQAAEIEAKNAPNAHPVIEDVRVDGAIAAGATVSLTVLHDAPEKYLLLDLETHQVMERTEILRASFYSTRGSFAEARVGDPTTDTWTAPTTPGEETIYVVLRDDRGGVAIHETHVTVR
jgi:hypothetical protein